MFFIPKLLLIILLSKTYAQNIETTLLPAWHPTDSKEIALTLNVFGKQIQLNLHKNDQIASSTFKIRKHDAKDKIEEQFQLNASDSCYYHHRDHISSAVINFCHKYGLEGVIFLEDVTLEIMPLQSDVISTSSSLINNSCIEKDINVSFGKSHLIKRSLQLFANTSFYHFNDFKRKQRHVPPNMEQRLYIELAVFVDEPAYRTFMPFLNSNHTMLTDLIITYVHGIQAVFHHPSLNQVGVSFEISLTHLDIFRRQPLDLPYFEGDDIKLLKSFCRYAKNRNSVDDDNPHWDIAIYLTGLDIYQSLPTGVRNFDILGISQENTICKFEESCPVAVVEFGVFYSMRAKFELTRGFASIYVAAHEIGHILGMSHDDDSENDRNVKSIMSSRFLLKTKIKGWSWKNQNEAQFLKGLDCLQDRPDPLIVNKYKRLFENNLIERKWRTAKKQCELFFRNINADVVTLPNACISLQCKIFSRGYFTGPPLHGTPCAPGKECFYGTCTSVFDMSNKSSSNEENSWSEWIINSYKSHCLEKSKGAIVRRRYCHYWNDMTQHCIGSSYDVTLYNDSIPCNKTRKTIKEYMNEQCNVYSHLKPEFNALLAEGARLPYRVETPWQACTIYCQVKGLKNYYYLPRATINGTNIEGYPYLPDGTWCHAENGQNYYCRAYYCLPEN